MNQAVTSKEELLREAGEIVFAQGAEALSIRALAHRCGIAVGSVYNYFPSKSALLIGVAESFWKGVFHEGLCDMPDRVSFPDFFAEVYRRLSRNMAGFREILHGSSTMLDKAGRERGKELEQRYFAQMKEALLTALDRDGQVSGEAFDTVFTRERFVSFLFDHMILSLAEGEENCDYLREVAVRLLNK